MTTSVVTVDRITPYQEIARLLTEHKIGGVPVLMMGRQVAGVVTESDLLAAEDKAARDARLDAETPGRWRRHKPQPAALTAGTLMSKPAITIRPDATIAGAARMMNTHGIGRLPVVQCVEVRRTGNFLKGIDVALLAVSAPIPNEGYC